MLAIVMAGVAMFVSGCTFILVLALLGRKDFQYARQRDVNELNDRLKVQGVNQARLWRYLETIDDKVGSNGHRVFRTGMPKPDAKA